MKLWDAESRSFNPNYLHIKCPLMTTRFIASQHPSLPVIYLTVKRERKNRRLEKGTCNRRSRISPARNFSSAFSLLFFFSPVLYAARRSLSNNHQVSLSFDAHHHRVVEKSRICSKNFPSGVWKSERTQKTKSYEG